MRGDGAVGGEPADARVRARGLGLVSTRLRLVVAIAVAAACSGACDARSPRPAPVPTGVTAVRFAALWPEQDLPAAAASQQAILAGDEELAWRTDPARTAQRFASSVLGWSASTVVKTETWVLDRHDLPIARVWLCEPGGCPPFGAAFDQQVILKQLVDAGPTGVWSVTDTTSGRILLDESPLLRIKDPKVRAGRRMRASTTEPVDGGLPDGARVVAGSAYRGACGTIVETSTPTFRFRRIRFQVAAAPDTTCGRGRIDGVAHGFVFVLPRTRFEEVAPESLFTAPRAAEAGALHDLTAIAVRFLPRTRMPAPPPAWLSRDPTTLGTCRPEALRLDDVLAGPAVPGLGVGIFVDLGLRRHEACHAVLDATLVLRDATGARIRLPGSSTLHVDGYLPGYLPDRTSIPLGWGLFDWCGRSVDGPVRVTIAAEGLVARETSDALARFCPERGGAPSIRHVPVGSAEIAAAVTPA
jgi:hypothetical protein